MMAWFMEFFFDSTLSHWIWSIVMGVTDVLDELFDRLTGRAAAPAYFRSWQNRPPPKYPLPDLEHDLPIKTSHADICGEYLVTLLFSYIPVEEIKATLSGDLHIDPKNIRADGTHPVIYMFGYTENLHRVWNPLRGPSYLEYAVGVPNLYISGDQGYVGPFLYLPVLHLNRVYPTILGRLAGYRKYLSRITTTENTYQIKTLFSGKPLLSATFEPIGAIETPPHEANLDKWQGLLGQPGANPYLWGQTLFLHYHWGWNYSMMQPVNAQVTVSQDMPALPKGTYNWKAITSASFVALQVPEGSFRCSIPFELLPPFSRAKLVPMPPMAPHGVRPNPSPAVSRPPADPQG
ncbi:MAG TPA: hypothetical protein VGD59_06935 [Acidisarcina sp.]